MAVTAPRCPHCDADLTTVGIWSWRYSIAGGVVQLLLCNACSKVIAAVRAES